MWWYQAVIVYLVVSYVQCINNYNYHIFENFDATKEVFEIEQDALADLKSVASVLEDRRDQIELFLRNFPDYKGAEPEEFASNPINVFKGVQAFNREEEVFRNIVGTKEKKEENEALFSRLENSTSHFPTLAELNSAARGLLFLFETYSLDWNKAGMGELIGADLPLGPISFKSAEKLVVTDLVALLDLATAENSYDTCIDLLRVILAKDRNKYVQGELNEATKKVVIKKKRECVQYNNQYLMKREFYADKGYRTKAYMVQENSLKPMKNQKKQMKKLFPFAYKSDEGINMQMQKICGGHSFTAPAYKDLPNKPKCRLLHHFDPYLRLGPFKLEIAKEEPWTVVFHEILFDNEIEMLKNDTKHRLSRDRTNDVDNKDTFKHEYESGAKRRVVSKTVQAWTEDIRYELGQEDLSAQIPGVPTWEEYQYEYVDRNFNYTVTKPYLFNISKRIQLATQMQTSSKFSSTSYQVTNYGLGGLCEAHIDPHGYLEGAEIPFERQNLRMTGDMIGTFMAWLSDCELGGATAFLEFGREITVWPTKGSAAFWLSLDKKGFRDQRSAHVGCPVLSGQKWILNKWLYMFDQFKNYPCGMHSEETHKGFKGMY